MTRKYFVLKNQRGDTLIMVMVAAAVGTIVMLGMASMMSNLQSSVNNVQFRADAGTLNEEIRSLLSSQPACTNSFVGLNATAGANHNITTLFDGSAAPGVAKYVAGKTYGTGNLTTTLQTMTLGNFVPGTSAGTAQMTLTNLLNTKKQAAGPQTLPRTVNISLQFDGTNTITSCIALANMSDGIWQRSAANINNIYFQAPPGLPAGGNVGIGTTAPQSALQVSNGDVTIGSLNAWGDAGPYPKYGPKLNLNGSTNTNTDAIHLETVFNALDQSDLRVTIGDNAGADDRFMVGNYTGAAGSWVPWLTVSNNGKVGIGTTAPLSTLQVNGDSRLGLLTGAPGGPGAALILSGSTDFGSNSDNSDPFMLYRLNTGVNQSELRVNLGDDGGVGEGDPSEDSFLIGTTNGCTSTTCVSGGGGVWMPLFKVGSSGNVGIGTTAPASKLQVVGGANVSEGEPTGANASASGLSFGFDQDTGIFSPSDGQLNFWSNNVRTMTVFNGNVGIGTTTPGNDANVVGGLSINGTGATQLTVQRNGNSGLALNVNQVVTGDWTMYDKVGGGWNPSLSSRSGRIGIGGISNPQTALDVNGAIRPGGASSGGGCAPEGSMAYDYGSHNPLYCNNAGIWTNMGTPGTTHSSGNVSWFNPFAGGTVTCPQGVITACFASSTSGILCGYSNLTDNSCTIPPGCGGGAGLWAVFYTCSWTN